VTDLEMAYWPGCVSRGFTTELHGSMALVAERLGIELVELDRANCCGAGVIAEHNQELADTLNARTFALAQQPGLPMMNICSTCQGAQSECQQRLRDSEYRSHINETLSEEGLSYDPEGFTNKNFLWVLVEDYGLDRLRNRSPARSRACRSVRSTAATSSAPRTASATTSIPSATSISTS
jgi:succinate dehydrogenase / fumarate reductase cytochrome b subunit